MTVACKHMLWQMFKRLEYIYKEVVWLGTTQPSHNQYAQRNDQQLAKWGHVEQIYQANDGSDYNADICTY